MPTQEQLLDEIRDLARQAAKEDRYPAVIELLHNYLKLRPGDAFMWFTLGHALLNIGLNHEAEHALLTALDLNPDKRGPILRWLGNLQNYAGRFAEAEVSFQQACEDPETGRHGSTWIFRGANLASLTQLKAAEECHRKALTFHDDHVDRDEAFLNLGYVLRAQGRYDEALEAFQNALTLTPHYPEALEAKASLDRIHEAIDRSKQINI